ncbi:MAG: hypothetical protein JRC99_05780 [Deltaproteobacteria bacterium]|nr:hypothetical protein [Deltaproteobacteria bacterium]
MKFTIKLILLFLLCVPTITFAELPKQIENDFSVLEGLIVMPVGEEYVVDLDASDRLHEGDILTMVGEGKNIIHPETGEIIGTVKVPVGYLQVTRMYSGYSYAKYLFAKLKPEAGIKVMRFEQVPVLFVDNQDDEGVLASQLKLNLPQFQWLKPDDVEPALLTFTLKSGSLVVTTYGGNLLHRYLVTADEQLKPPPERTQPKFVSGSSGVNKKPLQKFADELLSTLNIGNDDPFHNSDVGIIRQGTAQEGVWMGPNMAGNPVGIAVADFDGDGLQETAVALNSKLFVARIRDGKYKEEIDVPIPSGLKILSLDTLDLNRNGRPELYLTAVNGHQLSSLMIEFRDGAYEIVIKRVRWFLRVVELPGDELALIGQELDPDEAAFYDKPFYVHIEGGRLVKGDKVNLPQKVNLYSFVSFTDYENKQYYAYLSEGDYLKVISAEGVGLW